MSRIFSNGPNKDFVINPFKTLLNKSQNAYLAAPYFTLPDPIVEAAANDTNIQLIIGLNPATDPRAIYQIKNFPNVSIRYFTVRFHAKIYIFDAENVLLGSSNLTDGGLYSNREAMISLNAETDGYAVEDARSLFAELWESARVLTPDTYSSFKLAWASIDRKSQNAEKIIENAIGKSEPININVSSKENTREQIFLQDLRKQVYEQYRPSFTEISDILNEQNLRREDFSESPLSIETNRFLNWVRLTYAPGEEAWQNAILRSPEGRRQEVIKFGRVWKDTNDSKVPESYFNNILILQNIFSSKEAINAASKEDIAYGLTCVHAFLEQLRFVKGGEKALPAAFWKANNENLPKVRQSISHLIYGSGDFIKRFHDILYDPRKKIGLFGYFCGLELFGTLNPNECPPLNGRMAKSLRFLGYDVRPR